MSIKTKIACLIALTMSASSFSIMASSEGDDIEPYVYKEYVNNDLENFRSNIIDAKATLGAAKATAKLTKDKSVSDALNAERASIARASGNANEKEKLRTQEKPWDEAGIRLMVHGNIYSDISVVTDKSEARWYSNRTCTFFCNTNYREDVANVMTIEYRALTKDVNERAEVLKTKVALVMTIKEQAELAKEQLDWAKDFQKKVLHADHYIPTALDPHDGKSSDWKSENWRAEVKLYKNDMQRVVTAAANGLKTFQISYDHLNKLAKSAEKTNIQEKLSKDIKAAKDAYAVSVKRASGVYRNYIKPESLILADIEEDARVIVEEVADDLWVSSQAYFDYKESCEVEQGTALIFQGINDPEPLTRSDSGNYGYEYGIENLYQSFTDSCFTIIKPKSGVNTLVENGNINAYRHFWMSHPVLKGTIGVVDEHEEIQNFVTILQLAHDFTDRPVFLTYRDFSDWSDSYRESVSKLKKAIEDKNLTHMVGGVIFSNVSDSGFYLRIGYDTDSDGGYITSSALMTPEGDK